MKKDCKKILKDIKVVLKNKKKKKREYGCEHYKNLAKDKKNNRFSIEKNIIE